ncbi:Stf0 family sulfotransferase [Hwanghaeella sp.]|uniref:Stf0 family sulfotransferase n=1 Tax=Hwanghaeella sp. TaxID=2605943 RepID=UPI003CCC30DA
MKSYIICATPRTGSTLLCDLLTATGRTGAPDSFFMTGIDAKWLEHWGMPVEGSPEDPAYCAAMLKGAINAGTAGTGIFGLRLMHRYLDRLAALIDRVHPGCRNDKARLAAAFGDVLYIHLRRRDKLAQAISLVKAQQTGLWHIAPDGTEVERLAPPAEPVFDFQHIAATLEELESHDTAWTDWFDTEGIEPLTVDYESLSENPGKELERICAALGVAAPPPDSIAPGVAKLADAVSRDWMERFREEAER